MEVFDLVNDRDEIIGTTTRAEVHGRPELIHRVARVLVFNSKGELFLQKRSHAKDVQPGKWDSSVGGHVDAGESYDDAAHRETWEELGIKPDNLQFLYKHLYRDEFESEYVQTYKLVRDGGFTLNAEEIEEGRFWRLEEIRETTDSSIFTPHFLDELDHYLKQSIP